MCSGQTARFPVCRNLPSPLTAQWVPPIMSSYHDGDDGDDDDDGGGGGGDDGDDLPGQLSAI